MAASDWTDTGTGRPAEAVVAVVVELAEGIWAVEDVGLMVVDVDVEGTVVGVEAEAGLFGLLPQPAETIRAATTSVPTLNRLAPAEMLAIGQTLFHLALGDGLQAGPRSAR